ncbi:uncharacterized protein [Narcine bancroftii]|uniref:uncharacterized protein n=1 Tax=Narcine bancroftii TaxID=1343680 RepID=UPI0038311F64
MPGKARDCAETASDAILHVPGPHDGSLGSRALLSAGSPACLTSRTRESTPAELVNRPVPSCGDKVGAGVILSLAGVLCALEVPNDNSVVSAGQKPWMTTEVHVLLRNRDTAFKAGHKAALMIARAKLSKAIGEAKRAQTQHIHSHFLDSKNTQHMWKGIQDITNHKTTPSACVGDPSHPDELNNFYMQFKVKNDVAVEKTTPPPNDQVLCLTVANVKQELGKVNPKKAAGADNILSRVLRNCAVQLADVLTNIFNISLKRESNHH